MKSHRRTKPVFHLPSASPVESLESRMLLSVSHAMAEQLTADGYARVSWAGHKAFAAKGQWVLDLQGAGADGDVSALDALISGVAGSVHATKVLGAGAGADALI